MKEQLRRFDFHVRGVASSAARTAGWADSLSRGKKYLWNTQGLPAAMFVATSAPVSRIPETPY